MDNGKWRMGWLAIAFLIALSQLGWGQAGIALPDETSAARPSAPAPRPAPRATPRPSAGATATARSRSSATSRVQTRTVVRTVIREPQLGNLYLPGNCSTVEQFKQILPGWLTKSGPIISVWTGVKASELLAATPSARLAKICPNQKYLIVGYFQPGVSGARIKQGGPDGVQVIQVCLVDGRTVNFQTGCLNVVRELPLSLIGLPAEMPVEAVTPVVSGTTAEATTTATAEASAVLQVDVEMLVEDLENLRQQVKTLKDSQDEAAILKDGQNGIIQELSDRLGEIEAWRRQPPTANHQPPTDLTPVTEALLATRQELADWSARVVKLEERQDRLERAIAGLPDFAALTGRVTAVEEKVTALEDRQGRLEQAIAGLPDFAALTVQVERHEAALAEHGQVIGRHDQEIVNLQKANDRLAAEVVALKADVATLKAASETATAARAQTDVLQSRIDDLRVRMSGLARPRKVSGWVSFTQGLKSLGTTYLFVQTGRKLEFPLWTGSTTTTSIVNDPVNTLSQDQSQGQGQAQAHQTGGEEQPVPPNPYPPVPPPGGSDPTPPSG